METRIATPFGLDLVVTTDGRSILASEFARRARKRRPDAHPLLERAARQVEAYFARRLVRFDLPLAFTGTPLQVAIWQFVAALCVGEVISYGEVGRAIGHPNGHRAVAMAMGRSAFDLFVPAHRIVGADRRIKGAHPGSIRRRLLVFEGLLRCENDDLLLGGVE